MIKRLRLRLALWIGGDEECDGWESQVPMLLSLERIPLEGGGTLNIPHIEALTAEALLDRTSGTASD